jgi:hypothetical protein
LEAKKEEFFSNGSFLATTEQQELEKVKKNLATWQLAIALVQEQKGERSNSPTGLSKAAIATRINAGGTVAGEMALFRVNNTGNFNLFVSDAVNGVSADDVLISLGGVTTIGGINLNNGNLYVL